MHISLPHYNLITYHGSSSLSFSTVNSVVGQVTHRVDTETRDTSRRLVRQVRAVGRSKVIHTELMLLRKVLLLGNLLLLRNLLLLLRKSLLLLLTVSGFLLEISRGGLTEGVGRSSGCSGCSSSSSSSGGGGGSVGNGSGNGSSGSSGRRGNGNRSGLCNGFNISSSSNRSCNLRFLDTKSRKKE